MSRKPRRNPTHYVTFVYADGAATTCTPTRKPTPKQIKQDGLHIDADFVCREYRISADEFARLPEEQRVRFSDLLANRINTRRAIRDVALPLLLEIQASIVQLNDRLSRIERSLNQGSSD